MEKQKFTNILGADALAKLRDDKFYAYPRGDGNSVTNLIKRATSAWWQPGLYDTPQGRLIKYVSRARNAVPAERQILASSIISGPIIDALKRLDAHDFKIELYLTLLSRSIDKERCSEADPAFPGTIEQLSLAEALLLYNAGKRMLVARSKDRDGRSGQIDHLIFLNLVRREANGNEVAPHEDERMEKNLLQNIILTDFGSKFAKACLPERFIFIDRNS